MPDAEAALGQNSTAPELASREEETSRRNSRLWSRARSLADTGGGCGLPSLKSMSPDAKRVPKAIIGAQALIYTDAADELRDVLSGSLDWSYVKAGPGWPIFRPQNSLFIQPVNPARISLMCHDLAATMADVAGKGVAFRGEPHTERWGTMTRWCT